MHLDGFLDWAWEICYDQGVNKYEEKRPQEFNSKQKPRDIEDIIDDILKIEHESVVIKQQEEEFLIERERRRIQASEYKKDLLDKIKQENNSRDYTKQDPEEQEEFFKLWCEYVTMNSYNEENIKKALQYFLIASKWPNKETKMASLIYIKNIKEYIINRPNITSLQTHSK